MGKELIILIASCSEWIVDWIVWGKAPTLSLFVSIFETYNDDSITEQSMHEYVNLNPQTPKRDGLSGQTMPYEHIHYNNWLLSSPLAIAGLLSLSQSSAKWQSSSSWITVYFLSLGKVSFQYFPEDRKEQKLIWIENISNGNSIWTCSSSFIVILITIARYSFPQ